MSETPLFSVGDIVKVKELEQLKAEFGETIRVPSGFVNEMVKFCGEEHVIKAVRTTRYNGISYSLEADDDCWDFDECVFEAVDNTQINPDNFELSFDSLMGL